MSLRRLKGSRKVTRTVSRMRRPDAIERACRPVIDGAAWDYLENRTLMAAAPVIVFNFDEGVTDPSATTVVNTGTLGTSRNGTFVTTPDAGGVDLPPVFGGTTDDGTRSPAGGSYVSFAGDGVFQTGAGGRIEVGSDTDRST